MLNEHELLIQLINADQEAFKQIYHLYVRQVYQFVYGYIKEKAESEDITQTVFQKLWLKRSTIDPSKPFSAFIFTIAYRTTIDYFRKNNEKKHWISLQTQKDHEPLTDLGADHLLNKHEFDSLYKKALESLTPKRREVFILSRHYGLTNKQIAERLELSVKTVENHMTSALLSLKDFFKVAELGITLLSIIFL